MKFHNLDKVDVVSVAFFISVFEFFALLLLSRLDMSYGLTGFIDGFFAAFCSVLFFNFLSLKGFKVGLWLDGKRKGLERMGLFVACLANGVFLSLLFASQNFITFGFVDNIVFRYALSGFVNTFVAMVFCILFFNLLAKIVNLRFGVVISGKKVFIGKIGFGSAFFVGLFELFILPFMGLFFILFGGLPSFVYFPLTGLLSGFIGSFIACFFYNFFAKKFKGISIWVD